MSIRTAFPLNGSTRKRRSGRAQTARRQAIRRRVARTEALRAVGGKGRRACGRRSSSAYLPGSTGVQVDKLGTLPELNWCYPIRRRVGGNAGVYLGMS